MRARVRTLFGLLEFDSLPGDFFNHHVYNCFEGR